MKKTILVIFSLVVFLFGGLLVFLNESFFRDALDKSNGELATDTVSRNFFHMLIYPGDGVIPKYKTSVKPSDKTPGVPASSIGFREYCERSSLGSLLEEYYQVPFLVGGNYVFSSFSAQDSCIFSGSLGDVPLSIVITVAEDPQKEIFSVHKNEVLPPPAETSVEAIDASGDFVALGGEAFYQKNNLLLGFLPQDVESWTLWWHKDGQTLVVNSLVENDRDEAGAKRTLQKIVQEVSGKYRYE